MVYKKNNKTIIIKINMKYEKSKMSIKKNIKKL
jgi:hypothetical protein